MKRFSKILLSILSIICFATSVNAASYPTNISVYKTGNSYEYISGLPIYYNQASGYNVYVLNYGTYFNTSTTLTNAVETDPGFTYIINNSNVTNSSYKNYYIAQAAILMYQDYLRGTNNISSTLKETISSNTTDTFCYFINKLFNDAKIYGKNNSTIDFINKDVTFTKNGNYYYSNVINVRTNNLRNTPSVSLYNAPTSSSIINNTVSSNGEGSFQVRIPVSSLTTINEKDFEIYISGSAYNNTTYSYSNYGNDSVIYGRVYTNNYNNVEASIPANIKGIGSTNVRISILNDNENFISGLAYNIYSGDCTNSTCYSDNLVQTFTTRNNYVELKNVLGKGVYTLVNKTNTNNYNLPTKTKFEVKDTNSIQYVDVKEHSNINNNEEDKKRKINIYNDLDDSANIIKIYSNSGVLVNSYRSNNTNYEIELTEGIYYIIDTKNKVDKLYFKVTNNGSLLVKYEDDYVFANSISLSKKNYQDTIIDDNNNDIKYDEENNTYYVDDEDIEITNEVNTTTTVEWLSNVIDCPITSLNATLKYIVGAIVISTGLYLVILNVKKSKNNI